MSERDVLRKLMWKDFAIVRPLIWTVIGLLLALNLLVFVFWSSGTLPDRGLAELTVAIWIVIPNLFSFGAPVLLIGGEEEGGTNDWLRTLPVRWQLVWASRFWVVVGSALAIWTVATVLVWVVGFGLQDSWHWRNQIGIGETLVTAFFSTLLLLVAFLCSYAFRSPLVAKGVFLVAYPFSAIVSGVMFDLALGSTSQVVVGLLLLFVFWLGARMMAWNRMTSPIRTRRMSAGQPVTTFRAPRTTLGPRPSPSGSLLWQQVQQSWPVAAVVLAICLLSALLYWSTHPFRRFDLVSIAGSFAPMFLILGASTLGALAFHGDNIRRRYGFFADRGISPSQIWWTRLLPPAVACFVLLLPLAMIADASAPNGRPSIGSFGLLAAMVLVAFAFGQLVSQWVDRPILAFFAAPAYAVISLSPLMYLIDRFRYPFPVMALAAPVLFVATWRLTQRWLEHRDQSNSTVRVFGYTCLAVLLPCLVVIMDRSRTVARLLRTASIESVESTPQEPTLAQVSQREDTR